MKITKNGRYCRQKYLELTDWLKTCAAFRRSKYSIVSSSIQFFKINLGKYNFNIERDAHDLDIKKRN